MNTTKEIRRRLLTCVLSIVMLFTMMPMLSEDVHAVTFIDTFHVKGNIVDTFSCGDKIDVTRLAYNFGIPNDYISEYNINYSESLLYKLKDGDFVNVSDSYYSNGRYALSLKLESNTNYGYVFHQGSIITGNVNGESRNVSVFNDRFIYVPVYFDVTHKNITDSEWQYDEHQHWKITCPCGNTSIPDYHSFSWVTESELTGVQDGVRIERCGECGYIRDTEIIGAHTHNYSDTLKHDSSQHWKECTICGKQIEKSLHRYDAETVVDKYPTESELGRTHGVCICGATGDYKDVDKLYLTINNFNVSGIPYPKCGDDLDAGLFFQNATYPKDAPYRIDSDVMACITKTDKYGNFVVLSGNDPHGWDKAPESKFEVGEYTAYFALKTDASKNSKITYFWPYTAFTGIGLEGKVSGKEITVAKMINTQPYDHDLQYIYVGIKFTVDHDGKGDYLYDSTNHWKICDCGEIARKIKHNFVAVIDKPATHMEKGQQHLECKDCRFIKSYADIPQLSEDHTCTGPWETSETAHWKLCDLCGNKVYMASHVDADKNGVCDTCSRKASNFASATCTHNYKKTTVKTATCTQKGRVKYTCEKCGGFYEEDSPAALHSLEWVIDKAATTSATGTRHQECSVCGAKYPAETIEKITTAHTHSAESKWYTDASRHWKKCVCGTKRMDEAHFFVTVLDKAATKTAEGKKHDECKTCGYAKATVTIPKLTSTHTHTYFNGYNTDGTNHWKACACGAKTNVTKHTLKWIVEEPATEYSEGRKHQECSVCGYCKPTISINKLTSKHVHDYNMGWTKDGSNHWKVCECGSKADTAAHTYKWVADKVATAKANGKTHQECKVCGRTNSKTKTTYAVKTIKLAKTTYAYDGKAKSPVATVKDSKGNVLVKGTDYTVTYGTGRKAVGKYKVTVKGKGLYSFSKTLYFKINPKKPVISAITPGAGKLTVKMKTKVSATGGASYKIGYRVSGTKTWKTVTTTSQSKIIKSLKKGKKYNVRVRAIKKVETTTYQSAWTAIKTSAAVK